MDSSRCPAHTVHDAVHAVLLQQDGEAIRPPGHTAILLVLYAPTEPPFSPHYVQTNTIQAPVAPIVEYNTVRFNLTPMVDGPFVGYGPKVDEAWDSIANDSKWIGSLKIDHV
jgi:hypothetical protein